MVAKAFFIILLCVVATVGVLAVKNNFSSEIEDLLYKTIGAIAVASYFIVNSFLVNPKKKEEFSITVPVVYERTAGIITSFYARYSDSRPEESAMFKGLQELNTARLYNSFADMPEWIHLRSHSNENNNQIIRLELLEFVFYDWLIREASWSNLYTKIFFTDSGYGGHGSHLNENSKLVTNINLESIENSNTFIRRHPLTVSLPAGAKIKRTISTLWIDLEIETNTGIFLVSFMEGSGGVFDNHERPNQLSRRIRSNIETHIQNSRNGNIWLSYPKITISYTPKILSQYSNQTKREAMWFKKLEKYIYKDFSWDLLREYYANDFQSALNLYRNKYGELD